MSVFSVQSHIVTSSLCLLPLSPPSCPVPDSAAWRKRTLALSTCSRRCLLSSKTPTSSTHWCGSWRTSPRSPTSTNCSTFQAGQTWAHAAHLPREPKARLLGCKNVKSECRYICYLNLPLPTGFSQGTSIYRVFLRGRVRHCEVLSTSVLY